MPVDPMLFVAPDFQQIPASQLVTASPATEVLKQQILDLQTQVADLQTVTGELEARIAALEAAAP